MRSLLRILAVTGKEVVEVMRRPGALLSIVLGPLLILGLFGLGYTGQRKCVRSSSCPPMPACRLTRRCISGRPGPVSRSPPSRPTTRRPGGPGLGRRGPRHRRPPRRGGKPRRGTPCGHDRAVRRRQSVSRLPGGDGGRSRRVGGERPARGGRGGHHHQPADRGWAEGSAGSAVRAAGVARTGRSRGCGPQRARHRALLRVGRPRPHRAARRRDPERPGHAARPSAWPCRDVPSLTDPERRDAGRQVPRRRFPDGPRHGHRRGREIAVLQCPCSGTSARPPPPWPS